MADRTGDAALDIPIPAGARLNIVPFVSVDTMMRLVLRLGVERVLADIADEIEADFRRWELFDKTPRLASHSREGVIELMPTSDGHTYGFKYVNGHPLNTRTGRQTVTAFGVLAEVRSGYPVLVSEMTILTALRTAATSALAAKHLAATRGRSRCSTAWASRSRTSPRSATSGGKLWTAPSTRSWTCWPTRTIPAISTACCCGRRRRLAPPRGRCCRRARRGCRTTRRLSWPTSRRCAAPRAPRRGGICACRPRGS